MSQPVVFKEENEVLLIGWDYGSETVASAAIIISPSGLDKDGSEVIDGSKVSQEVKNGTGGQYYSVFFTVITNEGNTYVDKIFVSVYSMWED